MRQKISDFKDLVAWQEGHRLVLGVYGATKLFPKEEVYGLTSQMRRAAVSVTSNIAEGFGRRTMKDRLRFYYQSHGSLIELKNQFEISHDIGILGVDEYRKCIQQADKTHQILQGLITKTRSFT